jgi:peptide chain release factor 3
MSAIDQIRRRRTFAIISHPDAGKTTLTEKFLLYGGALHLAGSVRDRKNARATASDWMELEKQRGISVSSTVLQFAYHDYAINLLDTPGHRDFSEDTYRVLMAVDAAVMVLDAAKGIEEQTLKLFQVCRQRGIPIFTFINKCDRPGKEYLSLLDEIETTLGLQPYPVVWPLGEGTDFRGLYDRRNDQIHWFEKVSGGRFRAPVAVGGMDDPHLTAAIPPALRAKVAEEIDLLHIAGTGFDRQAIMDGRQTPVYFGSAVNNFGVQLLLDGFLDYAPSPAERAMHGADVRADDPHFSAFIFKIQANIDPRHRDRLAFMRVCSGRFTRDMQVYHSQSGKRVRLAFAHQLFGQERSTMDEAWPGDIIGITGGPEFGIGDTLSEQPGVVFDPIPQFPPECFSRLINEDTNNFKRFRAGLDQLLQEKVVQRFFPVDSAANIPLLGAVGPLQFDVVRYRLESEYRAPARFEPAPWQTVRWADPQHSEADFSGAFLGGAVLARDLQQRLCLLFESSWNADYFARKHSGLTLLDMPPPVAV